MPHSHRRARQDSAAGPFWQEVREVRQQLYARYFELGDKLAEPILESEPENGPVFVLHIVFRECKQRALTST